MAESDTILQLGIEAAREGNRDEARSLFSLLTRQEPDNTQAWLWLAGVADSPDERRAALERVVALDPANDMARKGLEALGVDPDGVSVARVAPVAVPVMDAPTYAPDPVGAPLNDEERYASELDSAFDEYDAVEKVGGTPRNNPTGYAADDDANPTAAASAYAGSTARDRIDSRRNSRTRTLVEEDDDTLQPRRSGPSSLALLIGGIIAALIIGFLLWQFLGNRGDDTTVAANATAAAQATANAGGVGGSGVGSGTATAGGGGTDTTPNPDSGATNGSGGITNTGELTNTGGLTPTAPVETAPPPPPAGNNPDPATANPQVVGVGTPLTAAGWNYTFPNATYAALLGGATGNQTAQNGRFVVVLAFVANTTGTAQVIPADLFVLKDAQGRVYATNAAASRAYTQPGINADKSLEDQLPADGVSYSVALVFDVNPGATNLVLFTRPNQTQGFQVLNAVP